MPLSLLLLSLLPQQPLPTVGDTVWVTQQVRLPRGMSVRPRPITPSAALELLGPPEVVVADREATIRYPLVMWEPGTHRVELPGVIVVRADGFSDTLAPAIATIRVRSVLPGPPSDTIPPRPAQTVVARTSPGLLPVLVLFALALLLLGPLHWWWRKRGTGLRTEARGSTSRPQSSVLDASVLNAWFEAGELRMAAEGWATLLGSRVAAGDQTETSTLVERLRAARFSGEEEEDLAALLAEAARAAEAFPVRDSRLPPPARRLPALALLPLLMGGPLAAQAAPPSAAGHAMTIGRLHYDGGGDWYANPSSLPNLLRAIEERTSLPVAAREVTVRLSDDRLWSVPYLHLTGHGNVRFSDADLETLRRWLRQGGFLHASDNYGLDESFRREMKRLFPEQELVEVPLDHPVYNLVYRFPRGLPKIHEHDGKPAQGFGIFLDGRLVVYYDYQSDLADGWEDPEVHKDPPDKHEAALRMGVNLFAYAVGFGGGGR